MRPLHWILGAVWASLIGSLLAGPIAILMFQALDRDPAFRVDTLLVAPALSVFGMMFAVPATVVVAPALATVTHAGSVVGVWRTCLFVLAGMVTGPIAWRLGIGYFPGGADFVGTLVFGGCIGLLFGRYVR